MVSKPRSRVAALRKESGISQVQLAALVGVTPNTIQKWENPDGLKHLERYLKLAAILGCSVEQLVEYVPVEGEPQTKEFSLEDLRKLHRKWQKGA